MKDTYHDSMAVPAVASGSKSGAVDGPAIDLKGFDSALIVVNTGTISGDGDFSFKLQESDTTDNGDFADVAPADVLGAAPATLAANSAYRLGYIGSKRKRYIRLALTKAGGTSIQLGAVAILGHAERAPVA